ncbi:MAG: DUF2291 family protein [Chryseolinea sp.]
MRNKILRYSFIAALVAFLGFKSVYFKRLDEVNTKAEQSDFDAKAFAQTLYNDKLPLALDSAVDLKTLISLLQTDPDQAVKKYSHTLAVGNICYFLVRGEGTVGLGTEAGYAVEVKGLQTKTIVHVATDFIYGNAIRDASGLVKLSDFNKHCRSEQHL